MTAPLQARQHPGVHIEERTSSKGVRTWRLKWYVAGHGQQSLTLRRSKSDAREAARAISQADCTHLADDPWLATGALWLGEQHLPTAPVRTFAEVAAAAIADKVRVTPQTRQRYMYEATGRLAHWADRDVRSMDDAEVKAWVRDLQAKGYASSTIDERMKVLRMAIGYAHRKGWIDRNWMRDVPRLSGKPLADQQTRAQMHVLSPAQVATLMDVTDDMTMRVLWLTLAKTGLRIAEALGLQVQDVDLTDGKVYVRHQAAKGGGVREAKSRHSVRAIPLDDEARDALRPLVVGFPTGTFVWHNVATGQPWSYTAVRNRWGKAVEAAGLREGQRLHDLRHSYATWLLMEGVPVHVVSQYLGHADASITQRVYAHVMPEGEEQVRAALARKRVAAQPTSLTAARRRARTA